MASLSSTLVWEVRTTGDPANGGAFRAGATGTDYSQQDTAQVSYTDLAVDATTNTKVTSAANPFTSAHVGNVVKISSTGAWTPGYYEILSANYVSNGVYPINGATGNGNFETNGVGANAFAQWNSSVSNGGSVNVDTSVYHSGTQGCRLSASGGGISSSAFYSNVGVLGGPGYYIVTFWAKTDTYTGRITLGNSKAGGSLTSVTPTTTWTQFSAMFYALDGSIVFSCSSLPSGQNVYIDDISVSATSVSSVNLNASPAAASTTGGVGKLGGAADSPATIAGVATASNVVWVKNGSYSALSANFTATVASPTSTAPMGRISGYGITRGDGIHAQITASGTYGIKTSAGWSVSNIDVIATGISYGIWVNGFGEVRNCKISGYSTNGIYLNGIGVVYGCEVTSGASSSIGILATSSDVFGCYIHDGAGTGISIVTNGDANFNLIANCSGGTSDGIQIVAGCGAVGNTIYNIGRHGINQTTTDGYARIITRNILSNNDGYGVVFGSTAGNRATPLTDGNAYYSNTSGSRLNGSDIVINPQNSSGPYTNVLDKILTSSPFVNVSIGDFRLNFLPNGGLLCRGFGSPLTIATIPNNIDMGVFQSTPIKRQIGFNGGYNS